MIKIKSNEELFNKWNELGMKIQLLRGIVQNDMEITEEMLNEQFLDIYDKNMKSLQSLRTETLNYIKKTNKFKIVPAKCLHNKYHEKSLTIGKIYQIELFSGMAYIQNCDNNKPGYFYDSNFDVINKF